MTETVAMQADRLIRGARRERILRRFAWLIQNAAEDDDTSVVVMLHLRTWEQWSVACAEAVDSGGFMEVTPENNCGITVVGPSVTLTFWPPPAPRDGRPIGAYARPDCDRVPEDYLPLAWHMAEVCHVR